MNKNSKPWEERTFVEQARDYPCGWASDYRRIGKHLGISEEKYFERMLSAFRAGGNRGYNLATVAAYICATRNGWNGPIPIAFAALAKELMEGNHNE